MPDRTITLCYRKIIDSSAVKPWEKMVFEDTYAEFRLQAQYYNQEQKYRSYGELLQHVPGADKLPFLVSAAMRGYLQQLKDIVPDIVDNLGRHFLPFSKFQFELINSDLLDKARHQIGINFYSEPLRWHDTLGAYLLVSLQPQVASDVLTHLVALQPYLAIYSLQAEAQNHEADTR